MVGDADADKVGSERLAFANAALAVAGHELIDPAYGTSLSEPQTISSPHRKPSPWRDGDYRLVDKRPAADPS